MAKEPKILLTRMWVIYNVLCFLMAVYMTVILIGRYEKDKSATSIAYRKYAKEMKIDTQHLLYVLTEMAFIDTMKVRFIGHME